MRDGVPGGASHTSEPLAPKRALKMANCKTSPPASTSGEAAQSTTVVAGPERAAHVRFDACILNAIDAAEHRLAPEHRCVDRLEKDEHGRRRAGFRAGELQGVLSQDVRRERRGGGGCILQACRRDLAFRRSRDHGPRAAQAGGDRVSLHGDALPEVRLGARIGHRERRTGLRAGVAGDDGRWVSGRRRAATAAAGGGARIVVAAAAGDELRSECKSAEQTGSETGRENAHEDGTPCWSPRRVRARLGILLQSVGGCTSLGWMTQASGVTQLDYAVRRRQKPAPNLVRSGHELALLRRDVGLGIVGCVRG